MAVNDPWQVSSLRVDDEVVKQIRLLVKGGRKPKDLQVRLYTRPCSVAHPFYIRLPLIRRKGTQFDHTWEPAGEGKICPLCWRLWDEKDPVVNGTVRPEDIKKSSLRDVFDDG